MVVVEPLRVKNTEDSSPLFEPSKFDRLNSFGKA
jgi:hypothetical protein